MSETTYYRGEWSSVVGVGIFRKRADQPNDFLIVTVVLPKDEAIPLADAIVELLRSAPAESRLQEAEAEVERLQARITELEAKLASRPRTIGGEYA